MKVFILALCLLLPLSAKDKKDKTPDPIPAETKVELWKTAWQISNTENQFLKLQKQIEELSAQYKALAEKQKVELDKLKVEGWTINNSLEYEKVK